MFDHGWVVSDSLIGFFVAAADSPGDGSVFDDLVAIRNSGTVPIMSHRPSDLR